MELDTPKLVRDYDRGGELGNILSRKMVFTVYYIIRASRVKNQRHSRGFARRVNL